MEDELIVPKRVTQKFLGTLTEDQKEYVKKIRRIRRNESNNRSRRKTKAKRIPHPLTENDVPRRLEKLFIDQLNDEEKVIAEKVRQERLTLSRVKYCQTHKEKCRERCKNYRKRKKEREKRKPIVVPPIENVPKRITKQYLELLTEEQRGYVEYVRKQRIQDSLKQSYERRKLSRNN